MRITTFSVGLVCVCLIFHTHVVVGQTLSGIPGVSSSNSGPDGFSGIDISNFLGAGRFYDAGFTGSSALLANIEGGQADLSHLTMRNVTQVILGTGVPGTNNNHATATLHAMSGSFGGTPDSASYFAYGVSYDSETWTGDIALGFNGNGSYQLSNASVASTYATAIETGIGGRTVDVFNSSWWNGDPSGVNRWTIGVDGLINRNRVVGVWIAGNGGPGSNTVSGPGAGYNTITVGALGTDTDADPYAQVTNFSSRGPNEFHLATSPTSWTQINSNVARRAAVDIVAPGQNMTLAGPSGGTNWYFFNHQGTSFAAPTVAGGAGLMVDAGKTIYGNNDSIDGRVIKAALLNSATKLAGWDNGQVDSGALGIVTDQALDFAQGAGRMNLDRAFDQYVNEANGGMAGTTDVVGVAQGDLGDVSSTGWDYGFVDSGSSNDYFIDEMLLANSEFRVTLSWYADRNPGDVADFDGFEEQHFADLNLQVFEYDPQNNNVLGIVAQSVSLYNLVEHLTFDLDNQGYYGISVLYDSAHWNFTGESGEFYGLAWSSVAIPEPSSSLALMMIGVVVIGRRKRKVA